MALNAVKSDQARKAKQAAAKRLKEFEGRDGKSLPSEFGMNCFECLVTGDERFDEGTEDFRNEEFDLAQYASLVDDDDLFAG